MTLIVLSGFGEYLDGMYAVSTTGCVEFLLDGMYAVSTTGCIEFLLDGMYAVSTIYRAWD